MKALAATLVGVFVLAAGARPAEATPVAVSLSAFTGVNSVGVELIDFEDLAAQPLTDQYASLGVVFSGGLYADLDIPPLLLGLPFGAIAVTNGGDHCCPDITADFLQAGRRFGFDIVTHNLATTSLVIYTYLGGVSTGSTTVPFVTGGPQFIGIADDDPDAYFDRIVISTKGGDFGGELIDPTKPSGFSLDNVRLKVPEPGSLSLLGFGVVALIGGASRKRRRQA